MKPANLKGAVAAAAAAAFSYLNPNSAIAKTAQSTNFGATFQQQVQTNNSLGAGGQLRSYSQLAKWPFSAVALRVNFRSSTTRTTLVLCGPS
jgi:hypothetical protein